MYLMADLLELDTTGFLPSSLFQASQWNSIGLGHITALSSSTQGSNVAADGAKGSRGDHKILVQPWSNSRAKVVGVLSLFWEGVQHEEKNVIDLSMRVGKLGAGLY